MLHGFRFAGIRPQRPDAHRAWPRNARCLRRDRDFCRICYAAVASYSLGSRERKARSVAIGRVVVAAFDSAHQGAASVAGDHGRVDRAAADDARGKLVARSLLSKSSLTLLNLRARARPCRVHQRFHSP
jgi:hypothetical protein